VQTARAGGAAKAQSPFINEAQAGHLREVVRAD